MAWNFWSEVSSLSSPEAPALLSPAQALRGGDAEDADALKLLVVSDAQLQHQQRQPRLVSTDFDFWSEVPTSSSAAEPALTQCQQSSGSSNPVVERAEDADALNLLVVSDAQLQQQQRQHQAVSTVFSFWDEVPTSASTAAPALTQDQQSSGSSKSETPARSLTGVNQSNLGNIIVASAPDGLCAPAPCRGAPVRYVSGPNAKRRANDQRIREEKKILGDAFVPRPVGRPPEAFDDPHIKKRQNWSDKQEGLAISSEILNPQWQARVMVHAQTRQGQKQMGPLADALNTSKSAGTMIRNCNEILKGRPQAAVTFAPEELKRLYPEDVVGKFTAVQCTENLGRLGVRAPENTLNSMRTTLARIGATGSIAGEAGVRAGGKYRAALTARLTDGITARDAKNLLPDLPTKYINAAKARENDTAFVSTLGENYASNTTREKISPAQANLYVKYFKDITEFKSGAGAHTKSRILTKQRNVVIMDLFAKYPKLLRQWAVENVTEMERINATTRASRTKFEADVVAAASHVEYDNSTTEYEIRKTMALIEYQSRLKQNAKSQRKFGKVRPSSKGNQLNTKARLEELHKKSDAPAYLLASSPEQKPCSEEVFWKILKDNGIKYTTTVRPTICPIHDTGPSSERALKEAVVEEKRLEAEYNRTTGLLDAQRARAQGEAPQNEADDHALSACIMEVNRAKSELRQVSQKVLELTKEVATYHKHLAQYETSRAEVEKIMENLGPDECLVYRDFVNQHSWYDNRKVCNLILVVIWKENGVLRSMKLNNFCSDEDTCSTDPYYVRDVFDFHMKPKSVRHGHTGLLSRFKKIYISGRVFRSRTIT